MRRLSALVSCFLWLASPAAAQTFETAGARALGMGGAFVAVADDASAVWWNPAGLATGPFFSLSIEGSTEPSSFFVAAASLPLGFSYVKTRGIHEAGVTVLQSLTGSIVVGGTLKYLRAGANAFDADVAVMAVSGPVKAGLTIRNVFSPKFDAEDGTALELPLLARAGVSYLAAPALTLSLDVDLKSVDLPADRRRMLAAGGEYRLSGFAVRAGARFDTIGPVNSLGTVGGSYAVRNGIWVDVWAAAGSRAADRGWGLGGRVVY